MFEEIHDEKTPIVADIDYIVRFNGWQDTSAGQRELKSTPYTLQTYKLHGDQQLFDREYGYIEQ